MRIPQIRLRGNRCRHLASHPNHALHGVDDLRRPEGFGQNLRHTGQALLIRIEAGDDDFHVGIDQLQFGQRLLARHPWHSQVEKNQLDRVSSDAKQVDRLVSVRRGEHVVARRQ